MIMRCADQRFCLKLAAASPKLASSLRNSNLGWHIFDSMRKLIIGTTSLLAAVLCSQASIIFDDFNTSAGHFGFTPTFSSTTANMATTSTSVWDNTVGDPFEGAGALQLNLIKNTASGSARVRFVSGGPPYNSTTSGNPAYNTAWNYTGANDGRIGLYLKADANASGWQISLNMDAPANSAGTMSWSGDKAIIADNQWHLYEWTIDSTTWAAVPGIGGGVLAAGAHTFDSIYIRNTGTVAANTSTTMFIDFVAKTDADNISVASLVVTPEPSSLALGLLGGFGLFAARLRRR